MVCRHKLSAVVRRFYCTLPDGISRTRKTFEYAELTVTAPNRSGRAIKLDADGQHYRLSCYGFDGLCAEGNIGRTIRAEQVRAVLSETVGKGFLNGVLLEYRNSGSVYKQ